MISGGRQGDGGGCETEQNFQCDSSNVLFLKLAGEFISVCIVTIFHYLHIIYSLLCIKYHTFIKGMCIFLGKYWRLREKY